MEVSACIRWPKGRTDEQRRAEVAVHDAAIFSRFYSAGCACARHTHAPFAQLLQCDANLTTAGVCECACVSLRDAWALETNGCFSSVCRDFWLGFGSYRFDSSRGNERDADEGSGWLSSGQMVTDRNKGRERLGKGKKERPTFKVESASIP